MYDLAMTIYFGMYGATMTTNSELFWGPDSIMMLPCERGVLCFCVAVATCVSSLRWRWIIAAHAIDAIRMARGWFRAVARAAAGFGDVRDGNFFARMVGTSPSSCSATKLAPGATDPGRCSST